MTLTLTVLLSPHTIPVKFIIDDDVPVGWAYPNMPRSLLGAQTLYDIYLDLSVVAWATLKDDDSGFEWKTYFSIRSF